METIKAPTSKRQWVWRFLLVAFIWLIVTRFAEIEKLVLTAMQGQLTWLALAGLFQFIYYSLYSNVFKLAMNLLGVTLPWRVLLPSTFASMFVNVVAPLGGASGVAVFMDQAIRRKQSPARTAAGAMLALISDFTAFSVILITGLAYLFSYNDLRIYEVIAAALLLLLTIIMTSVLLLGLWQPALLRKLLHWLHLRVDSLFARFNKPSPLATDWAENTFNDFVGIGRAIRSNPRGLVKMLLVSFLAYCTDLLSLYMVFRAFTQPVHFGILVAGFSMGILFWVITVTPQGIGLVEGMMALVFTSLGIQANLATVIALTFRGLTFWLPFLFGFIFLQALPMFRGESRTEVRDWSVRIAAILTALVGVINMISAVIPPALWRTQILEKVLSIEVYYGFYIITALAGFALLMLADGLRRRKQMAWRLTLVFLLLSAVSNLLKGLDIEEALIAVALGVWLLILKPNFHARTEYPPLQQGIRVLLSALGYICLYGISGFYLLDSHFNLNYGLVDATRQLARMFISHKNPGLTALTPFGHYFSSSIYIVTGLVLIFVLVMLIRPLIIRRPATRSERARATTIIRQWGASSTANYALLEDKVFLFTPEGSVIPYVVKGRIALAFSDPIGPADNFSKALRTFLVHCQKNYWLPVFYKVEQERLPAYQKSGLETHPIGDELLLDLHQWKDYFEEDSILGNEYRRLNELGYGVVAHRPPLDRRLLDNLQVISDEWLASHNLMEKSFSQGWYEEEYLQNYPVVVANNPKGDTIGFASLMPVQSNGEIGLDLLRHYQDAGTGIREYILASTLNWARDDGFRKFNFGFVAAPPGKPHPGASAAIRYIGKHLQEIFAARDLRAVLRDLPVEGATRYLAYPQGIARSVALALVRADSGEEFFEDYLKDSWRRTWFDHKSG